MGRHAYVAPGTGAAVSNAAREPGRDIGSGADILLRNGIVGRSDDDVIGGMTGEAIACFRQLLSRLRPAGLQPCTPSPLCGCRGMRTRGQGCRLDEWRPEPCDDA